MFELGPVALALLGTLFTFFLTALGASIIFLCKKSMKEQVLKSFLGFAAGVMFAASIWSMILPALDYDTVMPVWLMAAIGVTVGALFINGMDRALVRIMDHKGQDKRQTTLLMTAITMHNIPEGLAVGLTFALAAQAHSAVTMAAAIALMVGIGIQNFPEGAAVSLPLYQEGATKFKAFLKGSLTAIVEPIAGVAAAFLVGVISALMPWLLTFAAGAMIYVVVQELVPASQSEKYRYIGTVGFIIGFLIMMILDIALG